MNTLFSTRIKWNHIYLIQKEYQLLNSMNENSWKNKTIILISKYMNDI